MKKTYSLLMIVSAAALLAACSPSQQQSGEANHQHQETNQHQEGAAHSESQTKAVWKIQNAEAKKDTNLDFQIQDTSGKAIESLDINHEKKMHLIVVSKDLSYFTHIHPEDKGKGEFQIDNQFPYGGEYKAFADFKPTNGDGQVLTQLISVAGETSQPTPLQPDSNEPKVVDGKEITLSFDDLKANKEVIMTFAIKDAKTKEPITDLQPYLGAIGHVVTLDQNADTYLHVHPMDEQAKGPDARFMTTFPKSGIYKTWGQYQHNGKVFIVPFVINVP